MNGHKLPPFGIDRYNVENLDAGNGARPDNEPDGDGDGGNEFYQADNHKNGVGGSVELRAELACGVCAPCHPAVGNIGKSCVDIQHEERRRKRTAEQDGCTAQNPNGCYGVGWVHSAVSAGCAHFFSSKTYSSASK